MSLRKPNQVLFILHALPPSLRTKPILYVKVQKLKLVNQPENVFFEKLKYVEIDIGLLLSIKISKNGRIFLSLNIN